MDHGLHGNPRYGQSLLIYLSLECSPVIHRFFYVSFYMIVFLCTYDFFVVWILLSEYRTSLSLFTNNQNGLVVQKLIKSMVPAYFTHALVSTLSKSGNMIFTIDT